MKTTFRFIIAAMAAIAVFSSCQKELVGETVSNTTDGVRVISVQFDNSTKASLSDFTPAFTNGDKIRVSNSEKSEERPVTVTGTAATFTTTLPGELTAIYPADAAVLASEAADAPIASSNNFKVLATQDGTVEKAIIASATVAEEENTATFNGLTALFEITPPSTAKKITVTSLKKVESGSRTGTAADINTEDTGKTVITVGDGSADLPGTIYVALVPGVNLTDLSFEYITDAANGLGAMKGIPAKDITAAGKTDATAANTKYTIGNTNWHPYVTIGGKKWATMNIGATTLTGTGDYFMWGAVEKPYSSLSGNTFTFYDEMPSSYINNTWNADKGFSDLNCQFTKDIGEYSATLSEYAYGKQDVLTKYSAGKDGNSATGTADGKTVLESCDDAATYNWGSTWRMPEGGNASEFIALYNATYWKWDDTDKGYYVYAPNPSTDAGKWEDGTGTYNKSDALLFFPAGGMGIDKNISHGGTPGVKLGGYWTRTLNSEKPFQAHHFNFASDSGVNTDVTSSNLRCYGYLIRPVSD